MADTDPDKGGTSTMEPPKNKGGRPPLKRPDAPAAGTGAAEDKPEDGAPKLGEDVFYILGEISGGKMSPNAGERRAAKIARVWPDGSVNLAVLAGRLNDAPGAATGWFIHPGCRYDADGAKGTWHRADDLGSLVGGE